MLRSYIISWLSILKSRLYYNIEQMVYHLDRESYRPLKEDKPCFNHIVITNAQDLEPYKTTDQLAAFYPKFSYYLKKGLTLYLPLYHGRVAGHVLLASIEGYNPEQYMDLPIFRGEKRYYAFFAQTFPEYRKMGINSYLLNEICRDVTGKGGELFLLVGRDNIASQNTIKQFGFKYWGTLRYYKFLWYKKYSLDLPQEK